MRRVKLKQAVEHSMKFFRPSQFLPLKHVKFFFFREIWVVHLWVNLPFSFLKLLVLSPRGKRIRKTLFQPTEFRESLNFYLFNEPFALIAPVMRSVANGKFMTINKPYFAKLPIEFSHPLNLFEHNVVFIYEAVARFIPKSHLPLKFIRDMFNCQRFSLFTIWIMNSVLFPEINEPKPVES